MKRLSVLVAEDNEDDAIVWGTLLRLRGYGVRVALDGAEALRLVAEEMPDVALLDIGLPHADGLAVARELRRRSPGFRPLLVAITGDARGGVRQKAYDAGFDLYVTKPANPHHIMLLLDRFRGIVASGRTPARQWVEADPLP